MPIMLAAKTHAETTCPGLCIPTCAGDARQHETSAHPPPQQTRNILYPQQHSWLQLPNETFKLPPTSNTEYGFCYKPLQQGHPMFQYNRTKCDVTAYADEYCTVRQLLG